MDEGFGAGDTSFYEKAQERMTRFLSSGARCCWHHILMSCCVASVVVVWSSKVVD